MSEQTLRYDDIPGFTWSADRLTAGADRRADRLHARWSRPALPRRRVLKGAVVIGGGLALSAISVLPPARVRGAGATHSPYAYHSDCAGRNFAPGAGTGGCCQCGSAVSSSFCASDHWHRHDIIVYPSGRRVEYHLRDKSCVDRNAWHWVLSDQKWRCSDGKYYVVENGVSNGPYRSVCPYPVF